MAMQFDGVSQALVSDAVITVPTDGTICFWVKRDNIGSIHTLIYVEDNFLIRFNTSNEIQTILRRHKAKGTESNATITSTTQWYHVACYYTNAGVNGIFINGVFDISDTQTTGAVTNDYLRVGDAGYGTNNFHGVIDDLRIYNRVLPADEVATIYACRGTDGIHYGLEYRWALNEPTPIVWRDTVGTVHPYGVAISNGKIYIAESPPLASGDKITVWDETDLSYITSFGANGLGNGQFRDPRGIAISNGKIYVVDFGNDRVTVWNESTLAWESNFGSTGAGDENFSGPIGITIDNGKIYITDEGNNRVCVWVESGLTWDANSGAVVSSPRGIGVADSKIFIASFIGDQVVVLNQSDLSANTTFGSSNLDGPRGLHIANGIIYVLDNANARIAFFDLSDYSLLLSYGSSGSGVGQFSSLREITSIHNRVYVSDTLNARTALLNYNGNKLIDLAGSIDLLYVDSPTAVGTELKFRRNA